MPVPVQAIAIALPALVEALGMATTLLQSVNNDESDEEALAKLDAQIARTDNALAGLRAAIEAKRGTA